MWSQKKTCFCVFHLYLVFFSLYWSLFSSSLYVSFNSFRKEQQSPEHHDEREQKKKEKQRLEREKKEQKEKEKKRNEMHKKFKVSGHHTSVNVYVLFGSPDVFAMCCLRSPDWKSPCITPEFSWPANCVNTTCPSRAETSSASSEPSTAPKENGWPETPTTNVRSKLRQWLVSLTRVCHYVKIINNIHI